MEKFSTTYTNFIFFINVARCDVACKMVTNNNVYDKSK